jgi:uncharacterized protein (DUF1778 family)
MTQKDKTKRQRCRRVSRKSARSREAKSALYFRVQNCTMNDIHESINMAEAQAPVTISIRAKAGQRDLIDQAAMRQGRSRSEFMLDAACIQAEDVLLDQTYFALDAQAFAAFQDMLDNPPAPTDRLRRTLHAPLPWAKPGTAAPIAAAKVLRAPKTRASKKLPHR